MIIEKPINGISINVAGIHVTFRSNDKSIKFDFNSTAKHFINSVKLTTAGFNSTIYRSKVESFPNWKVILQGKPWNQALMNYKWVVSQHNNDYGIFIEFEEHEQIESMFVAIYKKLNQIEIFIDSDKKEVEFDPFLYPFGVLLYVYLVHFHNGLIIHASGVNDAEKGYLFTGLSGIGKSTMAGLWHRNGATVINDDRLVLLPENERYHMHNTPMVYYEDYPKKCGLSNIFILNQAKNNYCRQIEGSQAFTQVLSNCIQHLHTQRMVLGHMDIVDHILNSVPVYELGFYPDDNIVEFIRNLNR